MGVDRSWDVVRADLERHRDALARQGGIFRKSATLFVLRFFAVEAGRRVQKSISLGARPDVIANARALLASWQAPLNPAESADPIVRQLWAMMRDTARRLPNGRREFLARMRVAVQDPKSIPAAILSLPPVCSQLAPRPHIGRPRRGRLGWPAPKVGSDA